MKCNLLTNYFVHRNYRLRSSYQLEKDNIFPTPKQQPMTFNLYYFLFFSVFSLTFAQNLALNMPVTVTSTEGGLVGENAVDGSMSTAGLRPFRASFHFRGSW